MVGDRGEYTQDKDVRRFVYLKPEIVDMLDFICKHESELNDKIKVKRSDVIRKLEKRMLDECEEIKTGRL